MNKTKFAALERLEESIGYTFQSKKILRQALTHKSYVYEHSLPKGTDNDIFEFFGDSILGFVICKLLYQHLPSAEVGLLAKMKSYLVSSKVLYSLSKKINLGGYLVLSKGEVKTKGRKKQSILADAYEALITAIYLDGGLQYAEEFITSQFKPILENIITAKEEFRDYKSMLQEYLQALKLPEPYYNVVRQEGPDHKKNYLVELSIQGNLLSQGKGKNIKEAEERAARRGFEMLKKQHKDIADI